MVKFREKQFGIISYIKKYPTIPLSAATLSISTAGLISNSRERRRSREYHDRQLKATNRLTNSILGVDKTLKAVDIVPPSKSKPIQSYLIKRKK